MSMGGLLGAAPRGIGLLDMAPASDTQAKVLRMLPGGVEEREPYPSELDFFKSKPHVTGMAAEDGRVILNPFAKLKPEEREAVAMNEAARVLMRRDPALSPRFNLTPEQEKAFAQYGGPEDMRATIAARILSGDPSAGQPTDEQLAFVERLAKAMRGGKNKERAP